MFVFLFSSEDNTEHHKAIRAKEEELRVMQEKLAHMQQQMQQQNLDSIPMRDSRVWAQEFAPTIPRLKIFLPQCIQQSFRNELSGNVVFLLSHTIRCGSECLFCQSFFAILPLTVLALTFFFFNLNPCIWEVHLIFFFGRSS